MNTYVHIVGDSDTKLWYLDGHERLQRMLNQQKQAEIVEGIETVPDRQPLLLLRGDYIFDDRALTALLEATDELVLYKDDAPAAARVTSGYATAREALLTGNADNLPVSWRRYTPQELGGGYNETLKKNDPLMVMPVTEERRDYLEAELFAGSYKGVTDLITKWFWPLPARYVTRLCARHGVKPNHVTLAGLVLAILTGSAFWYGFFGIGLIMAWVMTFFDTVDGKLARVTVTSSRFGDVLDHGIDLIHPPLWYLAWGMGLATLSMPVTNLAAWMWVLFITYTGGRLCEGVFEFWVARFSMFIWRPFDSFNRLITARRNPNLVMLTAGLFAGRPDLGFYAVVIWHVVSTIVLAVRAVIAVRERYRHGPLYSWLTEVDPVTDRGRIAVRVFTRLPADMGEG